MSNRICGGRCKAISQDIVDFDLNKLRIETVELDVLERALDDIRQVDSDKDNILLNRSRSREQYWRLTRVHQRTTITDGRRS